MTKTDGFYLEKTPTEYLSEHAEGGLWSVIYKGIPVAQGSHMECIYAAKRLRISLPNYHWSGRHGKWFWSIFNCPKE